MKGNVMRAGKRTSAGVLQVILAAVAMAMSTAAPAQAKDGDAIKPPPCAQYGVCSSVSSETVSVSTAGSLGLGRASVSGRSVYVSQVGDANVVTVRQSAPDTGTSIVQSGDRNTATLAQEGNATSYTSVTQTGNGNTLGATQTGVGNLLLTATQRGSGNQMTASQAAAGANAALMVQNGNANTMSLAQSGSENQAALVQNGSSNAMSATQYGNNNTLAWAQIGDNLSNLGVTQYGNQSIQITQSR